MSNFLGSKKLKKVNIKVNSFCNILLILKYCVSLKYIRAASSKVLQKMDLDGLVISHGGGGEVVLCFPWGLIFREEA